MSERTSNKQILDAILVLTQVITDSRTAPSALPAVVAVETPAQTGPVKVDKGYDAHMRVKAQDHANNTLSKVVLYARRNGAGETKLAYALEARYAGLKDRGLIGPVAVFTPSK